MLFAPIAGFPTIHAECRKAPDGASSKRVHPLSPIGSVSYCSTAARKRANTRNKFVQKLIRVHKHGKVSAGDGYKFFVRRLDQCEVFPGKGGRGRKVLGSLKEE